ESGVSVHERLVFLDAIEDRLQLHPGCLVTGGLGLCKLNPTEPASGCLLHSARRPFHPTASHPTRSMRIGTRATPPTYVPQNRLSPFRLRLRIALTQAGAIEGEGERGDPPSVEPELSSRTEKLPTNSGEEPQKRD